MVLDRAIKKVQGEDMEKVGFSLKLSPTLKGKLQCASEHNGISMNSLICSILELTLSEESISLIDVTYFKMAIDDLSVSIKNTEEFLEEGGYEENVDFQLALDYQKLRAYKSVISDLNARGEM
ncbi:hypothetical protein JHD50_12450 [Sulfurimonas sp. MAG313]|nr:hypothetical protein [Sulfurimonas sp. MAG313]MDF1882099.1 hypothetical protein [Sulfurimonas sp. MAG313]